MPQVGPNPIDSGRHPAAGRVVGTGSSDVTTGTSSESVFAPRKSPKQDSVLSRGEKRSLESRAIVVGGSAGGSAALQAMLAPLPADFPLPILVVNHLHVTDDGRFAERLGKILRLAVREACDKQPVVPPGVYVAPANYHMLVERDETLALSIDPKVNWARPSLDVTFESAARVWRERLICVVLSGANSDGAAGARLIRELGGTVIAQDPGTAEYPVMPMATLEQVDAALVLSPEKIGKWLLARCQLEKWELAFGSR
jgi:two-component system chemotaxis response regulator CheB